MMAQTTTDRIELLLDRLGAMTRTITDASQRSTHHLDREIKVYVDRGAKATDQTLRSIDRELQRQIATMKRELPRLEQVAQSIREAAQPVLGAKPAPKATSRANGTKPAPKRAPAKKTAAKKTPTAPAHARKARARSAKKVAKPAA